MAKPSKITDMRATVSRLWCRKGYQAITLFGHIYTREQAMADSLNRRMDTLKNHEMIHLRQAQSTHNSWFLFYTLYIYYSFAALRYWRRTRNAAYYLNPFEMEAYQHMNDLHYLDDKQGGTEGWRTFARMPLSERLATLRRPS